MERGRGGIETDVGGDDLLHRQRIQSGGVGRLVDIATLVEEPHEGGLVGGHGAAVKLEGRNQQPFVLSLSKDRTFS